MDKMIGCCGCCSALRPRYKRLVDNIFPVYPQDGLVKANMEKLTFYSLSSPEKLDRIGEYLYQKAARDIYRKRYGFVIIAMEAMDQLLLACHAPSLNLFVESFLKMVQKLLESTEPQLKILATQSFVKFANIEEDTPSYHRRYDFFVSKFSAMCHSGESGETRDKIRVAGIRGLQAVVRKTSSDELVESIWESQHMDKIVPSLLFNMQDSGFHTKEPGWVESAPEDQVDPPMLAETCMRELVGRASFGHIRAVLKPVLRHFDLHKLWVPNEFAVHTFRIIIFSIQAQYSYTVVETLMGHLDENSKSSPTIRTSIVDVLSKIIAIAAGESVGPSVLEIINSLLSHLKDSVQHGLSQTDEKQYQDALINALGEFANHLPDYQKIEIMMFIMSKIPFQLIDNQTPADNLLQSILLKSLLKVGTKYQTIQLNTTFPVSFLNPLLRMSLAPDPEMRLLVQKILHTLIDRHQNLDKLCKPNINIKSLELTLEKSSRPDLIFINKHGPVIFDALYTSLQMDSNTPENIEAVYTTLALLCVELASAETVIDLLQLILGIQSLALNSTVLSIGQKFSLHALVITLLYLIPNVVIIKPLADYATKIIEARQADAPHILPDFLSHYPANCELANKLPHLLIDQMAVCEYIKAGGLDPSRLQQTSPYGAGGPGIAPTNNRHSWVENGARGSVVDIATGQEVDSANSSPGVQRTDSELELQLENLDSSDGEENPNGEKNPDERMELEKKEGKKKFFTKQIRFKENVSKEKIDMRKLSKKKLDKEKHDKEKHDKEKHDKEKHDKEKHDKEKHDKGKHGKETPDKETLDKDTLDKETLVKDTLDKEPLDKETLGKKTLGKDTLRNDTLDKEAFGKETLDKDTLDEEKHKKKHDKKKRSKEKLAKEKSDERRFNNQRSEFEKQLEKKLRKQVKKQQSWDLMFDFPMVDKTPGASRRTSKADVAKPHIVTPLNYPKGAKMPEEDLTFDSMKRVLMEPTETRKEAEAQKREQINHTFRTASFSELIKRTQPKHDILQNKMNEIFKSLSTSNDKPKPTVVVKKTSIPVYEENFPELFDY